MPSCKEASLPTFERVARFQDIEQEWLKLLPTCATNTPFQTLQWQRLWWETFASGRELLLQRFQGEDGLHGLAPLVRNGDEMTLAGDTDVSDYQDFLVAQGQESVFYSALAQALSRETWQTLRVNSIPQESPTLSHLPGLLVKRGHAVEVEKEDVVPGLALPATWDEYVAGLDKKDRHELRRKLRRLEEAGTFRFYLAGPDSDLGRDMDDFFLLLKASSPDKDDFLTPQREGFFRAMAAETRRLGIFKLFFMEMNGERVAAAICFDYASRRFLYNSGYKLEFGYYSVGLLLKALCIQQAIQERLTYFDFMRGAEPYKYHLGGQDRTLYRLVARRS